VIDNLGCEIKGVYECVTLLNTIKNKKAKNAIRSAISRAATILLQTIRPIVPVDTSLLRRAMGKKDSTQFAKRAYSIVGPRRGFAQQIVAKDAAARQRKRVSALKRRGLVIRPSQPKLRGVKKDPVRYAHLVGGGHKMRGGGFVRGRNFMLAGRLIAAAQMRNVIQLVLTQRLVSNVKSDTGEGI